MGCLKNLIFLIIIIFALIGFKSIGGVDFVEKKYNEYKTTTQGGLIDNPNDKGTFIFKVPEKPKAKPKTYIE